MTILLMIVTVSEQRFSQGKHIPKYSPPIQLPSCGRKFSQEGALSHPPETSSGSAKREMSTFIIALRWLSEPV